MAEQSAPVPGPRELDVYQLRLVRVLYWRLIEGWTLLQVGEALGCSRERARQLEAEGLRRLRLDLVERLHRQEAALLELVIQHAPCDCEMAEDVYALLGKPPLEADALAQAETQTNGGSS